MKNLFKNRYKKRINELENIIIDRNKVFHELLEQLEKSQHNNNILKRELKERDIIISKILKTRIAYSKN